MPKGVPKAGFRRTKGWHQRNTASVIHAVNPRIQNPLVGVKVPHGAMPVIEGSKPNESDFQIEQRLAERFDVLSAIADSAIVGDTRSLIVSGPAGVGKSYMIEEKLNDVDPHMINWVSIKGKMSALGLYKALFRFREAGQTIVIDDCDNIFADESALNILKAACDTSNVRRISWNTNANLVDEETSMPIPRKFEYEGTIIFITNYDFDYMISRGTKLEPHLQALMSRSLYVDLEMKTHRDCFVRVKQVMKAGLLSNLSQKQRDDVVGFMEEYLLELREISLRTAVKIGNLRKKDAMTNWKSVARITCCRR